MLRTALAFWILSATLAVGQNHFYDVTIGSQLANVPGSVRATIGYHAYPWEAPEKRYIPAIEQAAKTPSKVLQLDYEPHVFKGKGFPDPKYSSLEEITLWHEEYAAGLDRVIPLAKQRGVKLGIYSFLSLVPRRLSDIRLRHEEWQADQQRVLDIVLNDGRTLLDRVKETGGSVWVPLYMPQSWNKPRFAPLVRHSFSQALKTLQEQEVPTIPILWPRTAGKNGGKPVHPDIMRALIREVRQSHGNEWAVWARKDEVHDEFRNLIREELSP